MGLLPDAVPTVIIANPTFISDANQNLSACLQNISVLFHTARRASIKQYFFYVTGCFSSHHLPFSAVTPGRSTIRRWQLQRQTGFSDSRIQ